MLKLTSAAAENKDYRTDIDGLRGIAVLAVILFHIDSRLVPGGFVGVDIFFVISGYLISLHIFSEIEAGRFSLAEFYRRRIKRIAPAMLAVVAVTLLLTQTLFVPDDAEVAAEAAFFSLFSLANVYFWRFLDSSYFAPATDEQPFLHLWSLGVEEQFYIIWPLLLMAVYRRRHARAFVLACVIVAMASFLLGDVLYPRDSSFVYYMLPTRAGELLVGAIAAQWTLRRPADTASTRFAGALAGIGLVLMIGSCYWTSESAPFPGWRAIPPTLGTAMLIVAGHYHTSPATALLRWRPLVLLGVISYSAYLWHWPVLSIPRYFGVEFDGGLGVAAFAVTIALAWLSYRYIEQPARRSARPFAQIAWRQYAAPAGLLAVLAVASRLSDGYGPRVLMPDLRDRLTAADIETQTAFESPYVCQRVQVSQQDLSDPACIVGMTGTTDTRVILWGDSNASHYVGMLGVFAREEGYAFRNVAAAGCPPVLQDMEKVTNAHMLPICATSSKVIREQLPSYSVIWIAADWLTYQRHFPYFMTAFEATVRVLAQDGRRIVLIGKAPVIKGYDRRCRQKSILMPALKCEYHSVPLSEDVVKVNAQLEAMAGRVPGVSYFDANSYLCPNGSCPLEDDSGKLVYFDRSHLSLDASWRLGKRIATTGVPEPFRRID